MDYHLEAFEEARKFLRKHPNILQNQDFINFSFKYDCPVWNLLRKKKLETLDIPTINLFVRLVKISHAFFNREIDCYDFLYDQILKKDLKTVVFNNFENFVSHFDQGDRFFPVSQKIDLFNFSKNIYVKYQFVSFEKETDFQNPIVPVVGIRVD